MVVGITMSTGLEAPADIFVLVPSECGGIGMVEVGRRGSCRYLIIYSQKLHNFRQFLPVLHLIRVRYSVNRPRSLEKSVPYIPASCVHLTRKKKLRWLSDKRTRTSAGITGSSNVAFGDDQNRFFFRSQGFMAFSDAMETGAKVPSISRWTSRSAKGVLLVS